MNTVFWAIVVLGVLIFVHELGHFLVARLFGVRVLVFSLGFGPKIAKWCKEEGGTEYCLSAVPLGGYVKMLGESDEEDEPVTAENAPYAFSNKGVWQRFGIVFAGPAFNFVFAFFVLIVAFMIGVGEVLPVVGSVTSGMPAATMGVQVGDRILAINDQPVTRWELLSQAIKKADGGPMNFTIQRGEQALLLTIKPQVREMINIFGEKVQTNLIGIGPADSVIMVSYDLGDAWRRGAEQTWNMSEMIITGVWKLLTRAVSADQIGGPLMIAEMAGKTAEQGVSSLLFFMALISINLGILNLLPIPILDGGHLLFFLIEAIKGSPVSDRIRMESSRVGMFLLILLMVWAMKNDLTRMFPFWQ